ncbi:MAG: DNA helicase RecQ [Pseudomonadota bacterium]
MSLDLLLKETFGFESFRPGQREIVEAVSDGKDVLAILPTGAGKSLCFQLPALAREGLTVVISPLIALMRDQVRSLQAAGVAAAALTSANTEGETDDVFAALREKRLKLLYIAPERLAMGGTERLLRGADVRLLAIDEAHCVSQWGHDFRPDYLRIGELRRALGVQTTAFTATADAETRDEIVAKVFGENAPQTFIQGFDRPNLFLEFRPKNRPRAQLLEFAKARKGRSGIIYAASRNKTEVLAQALRDEGIIAAHYHAGMEPDTRRATEERFQIEDGLVVVATIAFGMGVDKPDIRYVLHADLPKSVEAYYQEIGRAGRDGLPAETLTLYGPDDIRLRRSQIDEGLAPPDRKAADHARLNALLALAEAPNCRRTTLLGYFGEEYEGNCGGCDLCRDKPELFDGTEAARKALSTIYRCEERYGSGHLIDVLLGVETEKVRSAGHTSVSTFGIGREYDRNQWQTIFRQLMALDLIRHDPSRMNALRLLPTARPILRGEETLMLRRDAVVRKEVRRAVSAEVAEEDQPLLSALKAKRRALAEAQKVPAYVVFPDRTLIEMVRLKPQSPDEMMQVSGIGAKKLERYGAAFLQVLTGETPEPVHPARAKFHGKEAGALFDQITELAREMAYGETGTEKLLTLSPAIVARISEARPSSLSTLAQVRGMDDARVERFGEAICNLVSNDAE